MSTRSYLSINIFKLIYIFNLRFSLSTNIIKPILQKQSRCDVIVICFNFILIKHNIMNVQKRAQ